MNTSNYIARRLLYSIPVLFLITLVAFFVIRLVPGDPALTVLGDKATESAVEAFRQKYGLDRNIFVQYLAYLRSLITLDLGTSLKYRVPVADLIGTRLTVTVLLTLLSVVLAGLISFPLSYISGMNQGKAVDRGIQTVMQVGLSIPAFWLGTLLLLLFSVELRWLPASGWGETWGQHFRSLILPAITQAVAVMSIVVRNLRGSIIDIKDSEFVDFAVSQGIDPRSIRSRYILKNSVLPAVTILSMQFVSLIGGSIVIEQVFTLPGLGTLLINAIFARDYAVVQSVILIYGLIALVVFIITDILYAMLDPRVRFD